MVVVGPTYVNDGKTEPQDNNKGPIYNVEFVASYM